MQASDTGGEFLEGNNGNCVESDTSLASRSLRSGVGFDDGRGGIVSTSEAKFESRSGRSIGDGLGEGHGERAAPHHQHRDPPEGARSDAQEHRYLSGPSSVTPASVQDEPGKLMSTPANSSRMWSGVRTTFHGDSKGVGRNAGTDLGGQCTT